MEATAVRLYVNIKKEKTILVWKDKNGEDIFAFRLGMDNLIL